MNRNKPPQSDSGQDLRTRFVRAAMEILEEPDTPLDLRKVAERAGKSRTAPYLVFGKERDGGGLAALRLAVAAEGTRVLCARLEDSRARADDALEAFRAMAEAFLSFASEQPRLYRLMYGPEIGAAAGVPHSAEETNNEVGHLLQARGELERLSRRIITESQEAGLIPPGETQRTFRITWATLHGLALLRMDGQLGLAGMEDGTAAMVDLASEAVLGAPTDTIEGVALTLLRAKMSRDSASPSPPAERDAIVREVADNRWVLGDRSQRTERDRTLSSFADGFPSPERDALPTIDSWHAGDRPAPPSSPPDAVRADGPDMDSRSSRPVEPADEPATPSASPPVGDWFADGGPDLADYPISGTRALRRAARSSRSFRGARVLWIDDHPDWLEWERRTLEQLGAEVEVCESTVSALTRLRSTRFDLIVSDIARGDRADAGVADLPRIREASDDTPVVFYVGVTDESLDVPEGAWGVTNRPEELLHLVMDVLGRSRG